MVEVIGKHVKVDENDDAQLDIFNCFPPVHQGV